ncbi:phage tail tape measure protein [Levilactobacillus brevis]|uniref:Phage tail tape measure protein, TP901 family n=1 Tax=Levilactobacillus brevis ATCC 14869 = DSM 20054 TaxID=649758 RepID=U2PLR2_LEVBR|nr:phage tail tape measure protein [Levilactobacillus brevis]ERK44704.1 phage tail tape measure protein, TP901 family [Levilactobacillus brevis ATCC 14869 = DSM 20054]MCT3573117.1 phage tail tape measure protein [Levilactobacillus brevis]SQG81293.1 SLT domain-containing protein [Levilactobacillus brevis]
MANKMIRHGTIGFSVAGDLSKLERANKLMDGMERRAHKVNRALDSMIPQRAFNEAANGFGRISKAADKSRESIDSAKRGQKEYGYEARRTSKSVVKSWDQVTSAQDKTRVATNKLGTAVSRTNGQVGTSATRMGDKSERAFAKTRVGATKARGSFDRLYTSGSKLTNMGSMVTMALLPVGAAFKQAADQATELENKYTTIRNLLNTGGESLGASKAETKAMQKENNGFALKYGVDPSDMASGGEELIRRGYSGKQELASHKSFLQASRASGDDYKSVVNYGASALEKFGYKTKAGDSIGKMRKYTSKVLNQMAYAADMTATDFTGIGNALNMAGGTAHSTNQSLASTVSALGVLSNNGLDGTLSGTGLRKVLNAFASPYTSLKSRQGQAIKEYGIDTSKFYGKDHNLKSLPKLLNYLNSKTSGLSESQKLKFQNKFFGATGQEAGNFLMANTGQIGNLTKKVERSQDQKGNGYIANLSEKNMKSWQNQINRTKQYLNVMGQGFAKNVLPGFTKALKYANGLLGYLIKLPKPVKTTAGYIAAIGGSLAAAVTSVKLLGKAGGFLFGSGRAASRGGATSNAVADVADIASSLPIGGKSETRMGRLEGRRASTRMGRLRGGRLGKLTGLLGAGTRSTAEVGEREALRLAQRGTASKVLGGVKAVGSRIPWLDVALSATSLIGMNKKNAGGKIGNFGGTLAGMEGGAALGSAVGPVGTVVGGAIGAGVGGFAGSKAGKAIQHAVTSQSKQNSMYVPGVGDVYNPGSRKKTKSKPKADPKTTLGSDKWNETNIGKSNYKYIKQAAKLEQQGNVEWANSAGKTTKKLRGTYNSLYNLAKKRADGQLSNDQKGYSYLKKAGLLNVKAADSAYSQEKGSVQKRVSSLKSGLNKLLSNDKMSGTQRAKAIDKVNRQIISLTDKGSLKQKAIMTKMMSSNTHLTAAGYAKILTSSKKNEKQTIKTAQKTYSAEVKSADKRYKKAKNLAETLPGLSEKQRKAVIKEAQKQRDAAKDKAHSQYKSTVKWAEKQRHDVVEKAKEEAGQAADAFNSAAKHVGNSIPALIEQNASLFGGHAKKPVSSYQAIRNNTNPKKKLADAAAKQNGTAKKPKKDSFGMTGAFASGSVDRYPHGLPYSMWATVNDGGAKELIIPPAGQSFVAKRMNQKVWLRKGTHVLNGRDTKRAMGGVHLASGTVNLSPAPALSGKKVKTGIEGTKKKYDKELKGSKRAVSTFKKSSKSDFGKIKSDTTDKVSDTTASVSKKYKWLKSNLSNTTDDISKDWRSSWKSLVNYFGDVFSKLKPYAHKGMAGAISSLNGGFTGIDSALAQFGGNKQVLKPIHYARGSHGPIASDRMAVLNDAKTGPRQELVVRHDQLLRPHGHDVLTPLQKGDEVLNGSQVEQIKPYLPHFAKGTGVSKSKLRKIAKANAKRPTEAYNDEFTTNVKPSGSILQKGIGGTAKAAAKSVGPKWSDAMWGYIKGLIVGSGGGPVLRSPGSGCSVSSGFGNRGKVAGGFSSHDGVDFSGSKVVHALQDAVVTGAGGHKRGWEGSNGIGQYVTTKGGKLSLIYQELNGKASSGADILVHTGDHIKQGQAIAKLGPSGTHVHIGATTHPMWSISGSSSAGWLDVTKLKNNVAGAKKRKKNSRLTGLVKNQLGKSASKWIEKHLQESDANVGSLSGSMAHRAKTLAAAIKDMYPAATNAGIAAVLGNWEFESRLDPNAINPGGGASGLGQWLGGRKSNLIAYAKRKGKSWKDAGVQLSFALNGDGSDSSVLKSVLRGKGSVASLANKFSSQWERGGYNAQHVAGARKVEAALHNNGGWSKSGKLNIFGEKDPEVAINPKRPTADGLIGSAIHERAKVSSKGLAGQLDRAMSAKTQKSSNQSLFKQAVAAMRQLVSTSNRTSKPAKPNIVINSTVNFNGSVDKDTADYATDNIGKVIERKVNEALAKYAQQAGRDMHLTD